MNGSATGRGGELRALLVAPDRALAEAFCATLSEARKFQILADLKKYPSVQTLEIRLRQYQPDVVLLDVAIDLEAAAALIRQTAAVRPPVPVIALDHSSRPDAVMRALKLGAREFLSPPFEAGVQRDVVAGLARQPKPDAAAASPVGRVVAFSSAKPGSGASTLACQTAFALGKASAGRVLLADLDLAAGTVGFYSGCRPGGSFLDLLDCAQGANPAALESLAAACGGVDVLAAPETPAQMPLDAVGFRQALDLARASYAWTLLDLPVVFHRASLMALAGADRIFLVATAELASLHLARRAVRMLGNLGVERERVEVVINQTGRRDGIRGQELEKVLGCPVRLSLPDDRPKLHEAVSLGRPIAGGPFEDAVNRLAGQLAGTGASARRAAGRLVDARPIFAGT